MALRVSKAELPAELREAMIKQLGAVPEPVQVIFNNLLACNDAAFSHLPSWSVR
jgi:phenylpyruvate tautomerase PptA (4-oxalocrotonate tautomerase family)